MGTEPQLAAGMWIAMMAVMMAPGSASAASRTERKMSFLAIYLGTWGAFGVAAAGLQYFLESRHLLTERMALENQTAAGAVLIVVGAYQLTTWKHACLQACRLSPAEAPSYSLACLGCCSALMGTLFVFGVMNYVWIVVLAAWIAAEKSLSWGSALASAAGIGFIIWGGLKLLVV